MHVCLYVCMSVCLYVCMCAYVYVCMYVCMYVCLYVCMNVCHVVMKLHVSKHLNTVCIDCFRTAMQTEIIYQQKIHPRITIWLVLKKQMV